MAGRNKIINVHNDGALFPRRTNRQARRGEAVPPCPALPLPRLRDRSDGAGTGFMRLLQEAGKGKAF